MSDEIKNIKIVNALLEKFADLSALAMKDIVEAGMSVGLTKNFSYWYAKNNFPAVKRGVYDMTSSKGGLLAMSDSTPLPTTKVVLPSNVNLKPIAEAVQTVGCDDVYIPPVDSTYVSWGHSKDVLNIINSKQFFPVFISGLSGNGKTMMVEQACAKSKREYVRVQINPQTDEDDLLGGFRLVDGDTVFADGPVVKAMRAGAILLLDEVDRGSNKIMALQGVLEGKPLLIKKTGEVVVPAQGFNVIATGNTKGRGSDDGRFISASIMDDAFLERFNITIMQPYPSMAIERKILNNHMAKYMVDEPEFVELLVNWSDTIRETYNAEGVEDLITTRRLCQIGQTFSIFKDRLKSIELCINRFDDEVRESFLDLYSKVDASIGKAKADKEAAETAKNKAQSDLEARDSGVDSAIDDIFNPQAIINTSSY